MISVIQQCRDGGNRWRRWETEPAWHPWRLGAARRSARLHRPDHREDLHRRRLATQPSSPGATPRASTTSPSPQFRRVFPTALPSWHSTERISPPLAGRLRQKGSVHSPQRTTRHRRRAPALHELLAPLVALCAGLGVAFPEVARSLRPGVPLMLAGQVLGVALTISFGELAPVLRRPGGVLGALAAQWITLPLIGLGLYHLAGDHRVGLGAFITAASPAEITSALLAVVAGGAAATAATLMTASVAIGCLLTPLWLLFAHDHVDPGTLVPELLLSVALPLTGGIALRSRYPQLVAHPRRFLDLAGISLLLVVFVGAGYARPIFGSARLADAALFAALLVAGGTVVAVAFGRFVPGSGSHRLGLAFPIGMREFGIATAVAVTIAPRAAGFAGVYGVVMMVVAATTASISRRRGWSDRTATGDLA